jgi:Tol biopolymer transport system component
MSGTAVALALAGLLTLGASCGSSNQPPEAEPPSGPDGTIAFIRVIGEGDTQAMFTANIDGSDEQQLTAPDEFCCLMRISPDRTGILVMPGGAPPIPITGGVLSIDGSDFESLKLTDPTLNLVPQAWSPDGGRIAFEGWDDSDASRTGIYTARASDLGDLIRVTKAPGGPHDIPLDYSPDGTRLVFYRAVRAEPDLPIDIGGSLWVVNVDGSDPHRLSTPGAPPGWWARWSPDGSKILFATERLQPTGALWTVRPDGSDLTKVFEDEEGRVATGPSWSPDGSRILFTLNPTSDSFVHEPNGLYVIDADGADLTLVVGGPDYKSSPEWWR